ncbi:hypothetical protein ACFQMB_06485 [Pseudobowmanella zhangzhouensis]|uniref:hypothetical protein n=1 Tax=Pseudobowmanella zhangzhouensis TaxID=1537679 RepID=UPI0036142094
MLLIGLFAFFLISGAFMYRQLVAMERVLADISKDGVPAMIDASQTFSQANLLLNSIQELTMASTSAAQRIALSEVEKNSIKCCKPIPPCRPVFMTSKSG